MSLQTFTGIPSQIEAGDTVLWTEYFEDFPVGTWTATARIVTDEGITAITGTTSGSNFLFTLTSAVSAKIISGTWPFAIHVTDGTQRATGKTGTIRVLPNLAYGHEQTAAEVMLEALETAITSLSGDVGNQSVSFNGQSFTKADMGSLLGTRTRLQAEIIRERKQLAGLRGTADSGQINIRYA